MNRNTLLGFVIGLIIAVSIVYLIETLEEFEEEDLPKGMFFLCVTVGYIVLAVMMLLTKSKILYFITLAGSVGLFILYFATRESIDDIGELGIISKTIQIGIITGTIILVKKQS